MKQTDINKQYSHYKWLHSLNNDRYCRAMRLHWYLYGVAPRGWDSKGLVWQLI